MQIIGIKTPIFQNKNNLMDFIQKQIPSLKEGDVMLSHQKLSPYLREGYIN